jgi:hypothetical protein
MIHVSVTVNGPGVTSQTCAVRVRCVCGTVTKVIRNKRAVRHTHVKKINEDVLGSADGAMEKGGHSYKVK